MKDQRALEDFNRVDLGSLYREVLVIDGNDDRFINVGVMVRAGLRIGRVTTWKHARHAQRPHDLRGIFSRDLLEVELLDTSRRPVLTVFNTHLRSQFVDPWNTGEKRPKTAAEIAAEQRDAADRRRWQAETAARLIAPHLATPALLAGDMN